MKTNNLKSFSMIVVLFLVTITAKANDQLHPVFTSIPVNPAYAGDNEYTNLHVYSRLQANVENGVFKYLNQSFSTIIDGILNENPNFGWGAQITTRIGDNVNRCCGTKHLGHLIGSWRIPVNTTARLNVGVSVGIAYKQKLTSDSYFSEVAPDLRFGLYYKESNWYVAASMVNLTGNTDYGTSSYFSSGTTFHLTNNITLSPNLNLQANFDAVAVKESINNTEFSINTSVGLHEKYSFAVGYGQKFNSQSPSISLAASVEMTKTLRLSASYGQCRLEQPTFGVALTAHVGAIK